MANDDTKDVPADSGSSGQQEPESQNELVQSVERLDSLPQEEGITGAVSGLAQLDPEYLGGPPGQIFFLKWMREITTELHALRAENRRLTDRLTEERINAAALRQELQQTRSEKNLRGLVITVGSVLLSAPLGFYTEVPLLATVVSLCGLAMLIGGWGLLPERIAQRGSE